MVYNKLMDIFNKKMDGFKGEKLIIIPTEIFNNFIINPIVSRLYLTDVGYFPLAKNHYRERKEGIEAHIFIYCTHGKGYIEIDNKIISMFENTAFCIPGNKKHKYYSDIDDPWSILWVHFKGDDIKNYPLEDCQLITNFTYNATNRMLFLFDLLFRVLEANYTIGNFIYITSVLELILSETYFREKNSIINEQNKHITNIIRYMYKNIGKMLTLEEISKEFELSKSYLNLIFQENTGISPINFFISLKINQASNELKSTDKLIYTIATELGYKDQYYFSRLFKKIVGVSPKEYRNSNFYVSNFKNE